jgi:hypothetical protein
VKPPPEAGPYVYVQPGLICGLTYGGPLVELTGAQQVATSIAEHVSKETGITVAPFVEEGGAGAQARSKAVPSVLPIRHVVLGYKPVPEFSVKF